jgi:serine kinase of HPr protein (carbohydrate metabolism regulator)
MDKGNRWVADDAVVLEGSGDAVYGWAHPRTAGLIAVRGRGVLRAADLLGTGRLLPETRVDALVRLVRGSERNAEQKGESFQEIVGVSLPCRDFAADVSPRRVGERVTGYLRRLSVKSSGYAAAAEEQQG